MWTHTHKVKLPSHRFLLSPNKLSESLKFSEACRCVEEEGKMGLDPVPNHPEEGELQSDYSLALAFP